MPLAGRKTPPAQVVEGQGDRAPASIGTSWSGMQQQHAIAHGHLYMLCLCASCVVAASRFMLVCDGCL